MSRTLWTIGHSNRSLEDFLGALAAHAIELVADIRRFPGSRSQPQFGGEALAQSLEAHGIAYRWLPALGGRRRPDPASINDGWTHPAFRAYADHVQSEEFAEGLFELELIASGLRTAVMCAEAQWWRCHRRIVSDVLVFLGWRVVHIRDARHADDHRLGPPAHIVRGMLSYARTGVRPA